jgi:hypothetical protein
VKSTLNLADIAAHFSNQEAARALLEETRWGQGLRQRSVAALRRDKSLPADAEGNQREAGTQKPSERGGHYGGVAEGGSPPSGDKSTWKADKRLPRRNGSGLDSSSN